MNKYNFTNFLKDSFGLKLIPISIYKSIANLMVILIGDFKAYVYLIFFFSMF